jgi:hypothetical protein
MNTMTKKRGKSGTIDVKGIVAEDEEFLRALVRAALQEVLEAEMTEAVGAEKGERTAGRQGYRSGYYGRTLITRVGKLDLACRRDPAGRFSTELFERYQRSERALAAALAEMYVQGLSTRKVKAITEELCGHSFSARDFGAWRPGGISSSPADPAGIARARSFASALSRPDHNRDTECPRLWKGKSLRLASGSSCATMSRPIGPTRASTR